MSLRTSTSLEMVTSIVVLYEKHLPVEILFLYPRIPPDDRLHIFFCVRNFFLSYYIQHWFSARTVTIPQCPFPSVSIEVLTAERSMLLLPKNRFVSSP